MSQSNIEWTEETWNPVMAVAGARFQGKGDGYTLQIYEPTGEVIAHWPKMGHGPHTFQVLTKRPERMRVLLTSPSFQKAVASAAYRHANNRTCAGGLSDDIERGELWPLPNVWLGVSVEDQKNAEQRIPFLLRTPAAVRFLSCEPLLGPIDLSVKYFALLNGGPYPFPSLSDEHRTSVCDLLDWVIVGGESGPGNRLMDLMWASELRDQCRQYGVPFFMKQDSGPRPGMEGRIPDDLWLKQMPQREAVPA